VDAALIQSLNETEGMIKVGIINTLGQRRVEEAVKPLGQLMNDEKAGADINSAAIVALGKIGGTEAANILAKAAARTRGQDQNALVCDAYLRCADDMLRKGENGKALKIYGEMFEEDNPAVIRVGAFKGLVSADTKNAEKRIIGAIENEQPAIQAVANELVRDVKDLNIKRIAAQLPDLSEAGQVQLLSSLADRGDKAAKGSVEKAINSELESVRLAALAALAKVGDPGTVSVLAEAAATRKGIEQQTARDSLYTLSGSEIDKEILAQIPKTDSKAAVELISSVEKRDIQSAAPLLVKTAANPNPEVRMESWKVLKVVAGPDQTSKLVDLLVQIKETRERNEAVKTVSAVAMKIADENERAQAVLAAVPAVNDVSIKSSLLEVLGKIQADNSLPVLRENLQSDEAELQKAAIRALGDWPNSKPMGDLLGIIQNTKDGTVRALAFRGYVRLIGLAGDVPAVDKFNRYQEALAMAANVNEQKLVMSNVSNAQTLEALSLVESYLDNGDLKQEAEVAAVQIGQALMGSNSQQIKSVMVKVEQQTQNDTVRQQARDVINAIEKFDDYIISWEYSGPYSQDNASNTTLFDVVFAPEQPDAKDVKWEIMPASTDPARPWLAELDKVLSANNSVAYLRTKISSDKEQKVLLEAGSDDGIKIWLNDQVVHGSNVNRGLEPGQDKVEVTLKQGWNTLVLKVTNGTGNWTACARFRALDGSTLENIKYK
jgi:HEAT repeat protein